MASLVAIDIADFESYQLLYTRANPIITNRQELDPFEFRVTQLKCVKHNSR